VQDVPPLEQAAYPHEVIGVLFNISDLSEISTSDSGLWICLGGMAAAAYSVFGIFIRPIPAYTSLVPSIALRPNTVPIIRASF
jgi:hypothetical protein